MTLFMGILLAGCAIEEYRSKYLYSSIPSSASYYGQPSSSAVSGS